LSDLSREELKAHLSAVEAQVRAALRIVASESKSVQQAHSALRSDLSAALIRLQADMNTNSATLTNKVDKALSDIDNLSKQRKFMTTIMVTIVLLFGLSIGILAGSSLFAGNVTIPTIDASTLFNSADDSGNQLTNN